jgi:membrane-associated protease RseP (regulator of RpoE activity)
MRRLCWLLVAGLMTTPLVAAADPTNPDDTPFEQYSWSFSSGKGRLGVTVMSLTPDLRQYFGTPDDRGLLVAHVERGSPAAAANLRAGDVITAVKGKPVRSAADVMSAIERAAKGDDVVIDLVRDRKAMTVHATLADEPAPDAERDAHGAGPQFRGKPRLPPDVERMFREMMRNWSWQGTWQNRDHDRMI